MATVSGGIIDVGVLGPKLFKPEWLEGLYVDFNNTTLAGVVNTPTVLGGGLGDTVLLGNDTPSLVIWTNAGDDHVVLAGGGSSTILGGTGNDFLSVTGGNAVNKGGAGHTFVFREGSGKDVIEGFRLKKDIIKIRKVDGIDSVKDVLKHAKQSGDNVVIKLGDGNKITLLNTELKDLKKHAADIFDIG